jgi:hypothetical protein
MYNGVIMKKMMSVSVMLVLSLCMSSAYSENYRIVKQNDLDNINEEIERLKTKCTMKDDLNITIDWKAIKPFIKSGDNAHVARSCVSHVLSGMEAVCTHAGSYKVFKPDVEGIKAITVKKGEDGKAEMTYNCETKEILTVFDEKGNCMGGSIGPFTEKFDSCE